MAVTHSDLEVVPAATAESNLQVAKTRDEEDTFKEAQPVQDPHYGPPHTENSTSAERANTICGIPRKRFLIIAAVVVIVIIAAAVGGGVGGALAGKSGSKTSASSVSALPASATGSAASNSTLSASITSAPTLTSHSIKTTSTSYGKTTLYPDCPSSNDTLYRAANNDAYLFRKICADSLISADNGQDSVNQQSKSLDDCINLCVAYNVQQAANISTGVKPICNAVCWRATIQGDDYPGQCFGFRTQNSSANFVFSGDTRCDSAAWINQAF